MFHWHTEILPRWPFPSQSNCCTVAAKHHFHSRNIASASAITTSDMSLCCRTESKMTLNQQHKSHLGPNIFMLLILLGLPRRETREVVVEADLESVSSLWIFCSLSLFKQYKSCSSKHIKTALGLKRSVAWISYCNGRNRVILNVAHQRVAFSSSELRELFSSTNSSFHGKWTVVANGVFTVGLWGKIICSVIIP